MTYPMPEFELQEFGEPIDYGALAEAQDATLGDLCETLRASDSSPFRKFGDASIEVVHTPSFTCVRIGDSTEQYQDYVVVKNSVDDTEQSELRILVTDDNGGVAFIPLEPCYESSTVRSDIINMLGMCS